MRFCDLHCDTPYELYHNKEKLIRNSCHISIDKTNAFERYIQCAAVWSNRKLTDRECFDDFLRITDNFEKELAISGMALIKGRESLERSAKGFILTVEDARIVCGDVDKIDLLYNKGVRIMTLVWGGESNIGGAYDTDIGLTDFGHELLLKCFDKGIVPDLSHASDRLCGDVLDVAEKLGKPVICTHSNSRAVMPINRNISDETAKRVANSGGVVGISFCPHHVAEGKAGIDDIIRHIDHYVNLIGEDSVSFGCDFDGIDNAPEGIADISDIPKLYRRFAHIADKVFFDNAYNFLINNI